MSEPELRLGFRRAPPNHLVNHVSDTAFVAKLSPGKYDPQLPRKSNRQEAAAKRRRRNKANVSGTRPSCTCNFWLLPVSCQVEA